MSVDPWILACLVVIVVGVGTLWCIWLAKPKRGVKGAYQHAGTKPWERNPRAVPLDSDAYPAEWSQPTFAGRVDTQTLRHIEMKRKAIDFLRQQYVEFYRRYPEREAYIETEYLWLGSGGYYFDVALIEGETPVAVVEVGRCDRRKLREIAESCPLDGFYWWPYDRERPLRVIMFSEDGWDQDVLKFDDNV